MALFSKRVGLLGTENAFKIGPKIRAIEDQGKKVIKCNLGEPDFPVPGFIKDEVKRQIDLDNTHYCDPQGILPLRQAVARHFAQTRGIAADPQRVVVFPGAKPPIGLCQLAYCEPGDEVIYPSPGYPIYESFIAYVGARPVPVHLKEEEGFTLSGAEIAAALTSRTRLIYLNFPSNPTGGVASKEQLAEIADVIARKGRKDVRVYADEVYEHILFDGSRHQSIASCPGMEERTILIGGASKSFSWTGGRIGWAMFPTTAEAEVFRNLNINYFSCVAAYNQEGARLGLESPLFAAENRKMIDAFQARRDLVVERLRRIPGILCQMPKGAFYVFPNVSGICESLGILEAYRRLPAETRKLTTPSTLLQMFLLFEYQVATMDRKSFGRIGSENLHFLRLSIATDIDSLRTAVTRIGDAAKDAAGFRRFFEKGENLY
jgi:aspartate/methionine/tyrosine aminotransferase